MSKQDKKELRQQIACEWLEENYLQFGSLRHDVVTDRLQVRCAHNLGDEAIGRLGERQETWRNLTDKDINTMVCQCVAEKGVNISTNEMWTALKSDMVPAVHPLRAWLDGLRPYTADQPDWIDFVASQVRVKANEKTENMINDNTDNLRGNQLPAALKENIPCRSRDIDSSGTLSPLSSNNNSPLSSKHIPVGTRSAADVETQLTQLLLQTQESHEDIILEVTDFRPGTELGYNTPCPPELQKP